MEIKPFELEDSWQTVLKNEWQKPYIKDLMVFVEKQRALGKAVFPPKELVFNAFSHVPFSKVKVVIIGQDPYHGAGQAHGLSFSVPEGVKLPPSLKNIFKELGNDLKISPPEHGCLLSWAKQGVLLLNATLTVEEGKPLSHHKKGWEAFTDAVILKLFERRDPTVFMLWGNNAQSKCHRIPGFSDNKHHLVLTTSHPSPLSAYQGFLGCSHFSKTNEFLVSQNKPPINWAI